MMPLFKALPLSIQERSILRTLLYFDIFQYPLTENEIERFSPLPLMNEWPTFLVTLCDKNYIFRVEDFYMLDLNLSLVARRKAGNLLAEKKLKAAKRISSWISFFPFVRSIQLSGSISKGYMDKHSDIDYFIITSAGRLWIVRTCMALFRRIFLFNSHKYFCTNYFIDEKNMEIGEKNIFTAIEASTLKPMYGKRLVHQFQLSNQWYKEFLPNCIPENGLREETDGPLKKLAEKIISPAFLDHVDQWLMKKSISHWKSRYGHLLNGHDFSIAFQSSPSVSRSHPEFYQKKVIASYTSKIVAFEQHHGVSLCL